MMQGFSSALMKNSVLSVGGGSVVASAGVGSGTPQSNQQQQLATPAGAGAQKQPPSAAEGAKTGTSLSKVVGGALTLGFLKDSS